MRNSGARRRAVIGQAVSRAVLPILATGVDVADQPTRAGRLFLASSSRGGTPRYLHAATVLNDGRILFTGGYHIDETDCELMAELPSSNAEIYDPGTDEWVHAAPMCTPRARHASVLLADGRVAVTGGYHASVLDSVEVYDPATDVWVFELPLPIPICDHTASVSGHHLIISGGLIGNFVVDLDHEDEASS